MNCGALCETIKPNPGGNAFTVGQNTMKEHLIYVSAAKDICARFETLTATSIICRALIEQLLVSLFKDNQFTLVRCITRRLDEGLLALPDVVALDFITVHGGMLMSMIEAGEDRWFEKPLLDLCKFLLDDITRDSPSYKTVSELAIAGGH
jgi:hypothetical protein